MELASIQNLTFAYPEQDTPVLRDVSISLNPGDFAVLAGPSGSGKSTLLRQLKTVLAPHGRLGGQILLNGTPIDDIPVREQAARIGFVMQSPDSQIVTDKVWHELAFGLESLGVPNAEIRGRVAEMASFFGIQTWFHMETNQLSGGQKQLLNLASIMVLQPELLILDEPTSQLDPIAATDFLQTLGRINRELGTTILICEHRLEDVIPLSNRLIIMDRGAVIADDSPAVSFDILRRLGHPMLLSMPTPMRVWSAAGFGGECPLTVSDGRNALTEFASLHPLRPVETRGAAPHPSTPCIELREIWFRYEKNGPDILKGLSLAAYPGELLCILGGNGTGKSTTLSILSGIPKPYRGKRICNAARISALPQNPQMLLVHKNVREELLSVADAVRAGEMAALCRLDALLDRHPYDLSGGEQQRTALAKVLLQNPDILLLDEPTKGLDNDFKELFAAILRELTDRGVCIIMVSHDVEFCAAYADRCALFFDGCIVTVDAPQPFFAGKSFYTTAANRMARHLLPDAITPEDIITACGAAVPARPPHSRGHIPDLTPPPQSQYKKLPLWRRVLGAVSGIGFLGCLSYALTRVELSRLYQGNAFFQSYGLLYFAMFALLFTFCACFSRRAPAQQQRLLKGRLSARSRLVLLLCLLAIPVTLWLSLKLGGARKYMVTSVLIVLESMIPFFVAFEGRRPQARELVILSVLSALAIGGRAVFFALPGFKPVAALVILSGVAFGAESGFLVGAITMLVSNVLLGQGPWTPWQMFAMGVLGLLAGILFQKGLLSRDRLSLSIFGGLSIFVIYGGILNPTSVWMYQSKPTLKMILATFVTGLPADAVHAMATVFFLWFLSDTMLEKLDRVKVKYGLIQ